MNSPSVLVVEDSALFRMALQNLLSQVQGPRFVLCSSSSFLKQMAKLDQDIVLIDAVTWILGTEALTEAIQLVSTTASVILLGRDDQLEKHIEAIRAGAVGFVKQTAHLKVLLKAIKAVGRGEVWFEERLLRAILSQANPEQKPIRLNEREQRILHLITTGKTNKEIAVQLGFTERTIKGYVSTLFRRTGVPNRSALTGYALAHGLTRLALASGSSVRLP